MKVPIIKRLRSLSSIDRNNEKENEDMKHGGSLDFASAPNSPTTNNPQTQSGSTTTTNTQAPPTPSGKDLVSKKSDKQYLQPTSSSMSLKEGKSSKSTPSSSVKNTPRMTPRQTPSQTPRKTPRMIPEEGEGFESLGPISEDTPEDEHKSGSFFSKFVNVAFSSFSIDATPETSVPSTLSTPRNSSSRVTSPNMQSQPGSRSQSRRQSRIEL